MELNEAIDAFNLLLSKHGVRSRKLSAVNSVSGAQAILSKFGGMGSVSDLYICAANGHNIEPESEVAVNQKLHSLLDCIYTHCKTKAGQ
ncbi:DUF6966 domain-containing protein [Microbulbifer sp. SSSA005]|uniref:DUF6966 domain-containing protein n=1 Tax=unclassified Microbulbifer TaxID=2619833 RepID=UPI00403B0789